MQKIWSQYYLTGELAKKYSHSTYLASPINQPERQVVLTIFASSLFRSPHECEDLLQKAQHIKDCQHPYLMPILDTGIEEGQPFIVREYLPNGSLRHCLKEISPDRLELREALTIVSQIGQALIYAHEQNILHGNIKPENISPSIRERAARHAAFQLPEASGIEPNMAELAGAHPSINSRVLEQTGTLSLTESLTSAMQSRLFTASLSQDGDHLVNNENTSSPRQPRRQKDEQSSALMFEAMSLAESLTAELAVATQVAEQEPDGVLHTDLFGEQEADTSFVIAPVSSHKHSHSKTSELTLVVDSTTDVSGSRTVKTARRRRGLLRLMVLLAISVTLLTYAFEPFVAPFWSLGTAKLGGHSYPTHTTAGNNLITNSLFYQIPSQKNDLTDIPTTTLTTSITTTANYKVNAVNARSSPNASSPSNASNASNPSSNSNSNPSSTSKTTSGSANSNPYFSSGTLALSDPLSDNSRGYGWEDFAPNSGGASCQFIGGRYHSAESQSAYHACHASLQVSNFTLEVQMQIISGNCGGLVLRDTMSQAHAYGFEVCQNGSYALYRLDGFSAGWTVLTSSTNGAITTGLNQSNVIAAVVNGSTFNLYVNHQEITSVTDGTYTQGQFGLAADGNTAAVYTNARMWTL